MRRIFFNRNNEDDAFVEDKFEMDSLSDQSDDEVSVYSQQVFFFNIDESENDRFDYVDYFRISTAISFDDVF